MKILKEMAPSASLVRVQQTWVRLAACVFFMLPFQLQAAVIVMSTTIQSQVDGNTAGKAEAFKTTANAAGTITSLSIYVDSSSTASKLVAGLYADANGHPGALLEQGSSSSLTDGAWNTIAVPQFNLTQGTRYWIAILGTQSGIAKFRDRKGGCSSETSSATNLTTLPSSWTTGQIWDDCPVSGFGNSVP